MNFFEGLENFYGSLDLIGVLIFWVFVILFLFLAFFTVNLFIKNKELKKMLENELSKNNDNKIENVYEDSSPIKEVTTNVVNNYIEEEVENKITEEILEENKEDTKPLEETRPYSKNVLREIHTRNQTSPIRIQRRARELDETNTDILNDEEDNINNGKSYVEEVKENLEKETIPETIELTDYEKQQEEEAIISYQELLKAKDKLYNITDDEDIDNFIDNLKEFRANL